MDGLYSSLWTMQEEAEQVRSRNLPETQSYTGFPEQETSRTLLILGCIEWKMFLITPLLRSDEKNTP